MLFVQSGDSNNLKINTYWYTYIYNLTRDQASGVIMVLLRQFFFVWTKLSWTTLIRQLQRPKFRFGRTVSQQQQPLMYSCTLVSWWSCLYSHPFLILVLKLYYRDHDWPYIIILMSKTVVLHVRFESLYISLLSAGKSLCWRLDWGSLINLSILWQEFSFHSAILIVHFINYHV